MRILILLLGVLGLVVICFRTCTKTKDVTNSDKLCRFNKQELYKKRVQSILSIILGISGIIICTYGSILGIIGIILGIAGLYNNKQDVKAKLGIALNSIAILIGSLTLILMNIPHEMPNVVGEGLDAAKTAIKLISDDMYYNIEIVEEFSDTVEEDIVISVTPEAGEKVSDNETITIVVSKGKEK